MQGSGTSCREDADVRRRCCLTCESDVSPYHCEPTGRANARPMTGSAKQSISQLAEGWIASSLSLLAMTGRLATPAVHRVRHHPRSDASSRARLSRAFASQVSAKAASGKITGRAAKRLSTSARPAR
jgi:hypothetical protein